MNSTSNEALKSMCARFDENFSIAFHQLKSSGELLAGQRRVLKKIKKVQVQLATSTPKIKQKNRYAGPCANTRSL